MIDFKKEVLDPSFKLPVLVDFWAPWCGPCRSLTPIIEQIALEQKDRWSLVKINTEEDEELAREYHITSIPNVKLFYRGEVVHEFLGALSKQMILDWLKKVLPGSGLMALDQFLEKNDQPSPEDLEHLLAEHPDSQEIAFVLSQIYLWDDPSRAIELVKGIKSGSPFYDKSNHISEIGNFLLDASEDEQINRVRTLLKSSDLEAAIKEILEMLQQSRNVYPGILSKVAIGIFNLLGSHHPLTKKYRKLLDMALWV